MAYKQNQKIHKRQSQARTTKKIFYGVLLIIFAGISVVTFDWALSNLRDNTTVVTTEQTRSVQSSNVSIYRTKYYQFQAVDGWVEVDNDNYPGERFVYVKNDENLITQRLIIYINRSDREKEVDMKNNYVLPVSLGPLGRFINVGRVSEHCNESWPVNANRNPARIIHEGVSFVCTPDTQQYNVIVGELGDDENISAELDDGTKVELTIVYSDLTAYPSHGEIYNIIDSFVIL